MSSKVSIGVSRVAIWVAVAAIANVVLFFIGENAGATYRVGSPVPIDALMTGIATVVPLAIGASVASLVGKKGSKALNILVWVGFVVAIISAPNGWVMSQDATTGLTLGAMHLVAALAWLLAVKPRKAA
jgi:hypothetical protein